MATIDNVLLNIKGDTQDYNSVKTAVLNRMVLDGKITEEEHEYYNTAWNIIIIKRSWFEKWWNKFAKGESDGYIIKYINFEDYDKK